MLDICRFKMKQLTNTNSSYLNSALRYFRSHDFLRSLAMTTLMLISGVVLYLSGYNNWIVGTCVGILLTQFNDIQGSHNYRTIAMILSSFLSCLTVIAVNFLQFSLPLVLLFIAVTTFALYMLSIFGARAQSFAFAGSLGIVLSLVKTYSGKELYVYALTVLAGGLLYTLISSTYHLLTRKRQINEQLGELAKLTADYLEYRIFLTKQSDFKQEVNHMLLDLQVAIIEKQQKLGSLILSDRLIRYHSSTRNKQMFLLKELIDFMELAVANPSNLSKLKTLQHTNLDTIQPFINIAEQISNRLVSIAKELRSFKVNTIEPIALDFSVAETTIQNYLDTVGLPQAREGVLLMSNLLDYYRFQIKHLTTIEIMIGNTSNPEVLALSFDQQAQFLQEEHYNFNQVLANVTIKSTVFRQALRMSIALIIGYLAGVLLNVDRVYWILLTILLILRMSYGMTIQRAKMRVLGTAIGALIAFTLVQLSTSVVFFIVLASIGLVFSFSLLERNYTLSSLTITIGVIFAFALLDPNVIKVIQFRFIDTIIGALVSIVVATLILPFWEHQSFQNSFSKAIKANQLYFQEIFNFYNSDKKNDTNYRLKRKSAFLASSNLNTNFQRYKKDPKSKQKDYHLFYDLVTINHTLVATMTSLGNYLKERNIPKLTPILKDIWVDISQEFNAILNNEVRVPEAINSYKNLEIYWQTLEDKRNREFAEGKTVIDPNFKQELQEVQMVLLEIKRIRELTQTMDELVITAF